MRVMKNICKLMGVLLGITIILVMGLGSKLLWDGYTLYKEVIVEVPLEKAVATIYQKENFVDIEDVNKHFTQAIVAVEDHRFYEHQGIDAIGLARALATNVLRGEVVQGGSTITQQLAKNLYFGHEQTLKRKVAELFVTLDLEKKYVKDELLELYINLIYFGRGAYGVESASQTFFQKSASQLTKEESAYLAGLPQAPSVYGENDDLAIERQQIVLEAMEAYIEE